MKRVVLIFLLALCVFSGSELYSQGWAAEIRVEFNHTGYSIEDLQSTSVTYSGVTSTTPYESTSYYALYYLTGTGTPNGDFSVCAYGEASDPYEPWNDPPTSYISPCFAKNYPYSATNCTGGAYTGDNGTDRDYVFGYINVYPKQEVNINHTTDRTCTHTTMRSYICHGSNLLWEVAEKADGPFKTLSNTGNVINVTPDDIYNAGLSDKYGVKYFRATGYPGTTSDPVQVRIYYPSPTVSVSKTDPLCHNSSDGTITINITSSTPWIDAFNLVVKRANESGAYTESPSGSPTFSITKSIFNADNYQVTVTNNDSISKYGNCWTTVNVPTLLNPEKVRVSSFTPSNHNGYNISCKGGNNGTVTANIAGGSGAYAQYIWTPTTGSSSNYADQLKAGTYKLKIQDSNNCWSDDHPITLTEPDSLKVTLQSTGGTGGFDVTCWNIPDGVLKTNVTGGTGTKSYLWNTGTTTNQISGLLTGAYNVVVTDGNGCNASGSKILNAPPPIDFTINEISGITCPEYSTGSLEAVSIVNTIGNKYYLWSSGENTPGIENKKSGTYSLKISDDQGCSTTKSRTLVEPPQYIVSIAPQSNFNGSPIKCYSESNGVINSTVGKPAASPAPTNYEWVKNNNLHSSGSTLTSINSLNEGLYKLIITYNGICKAESPVLFLNDPDPIVADVTGNSNYNGQLIRCAGESNASLKVIASGGTGLFTYDWNTGSSNAIVSGLGAGKYWTTVKDANNCTGSDTLIIANPTPVVASISGFSNYSGYGVSCNNSIGGNINNNGSITAFASGGTGSGYTYSWSSGQTTASINGLTANTYTVTVRDNNNCQNVISHAITAPPLLTLNSPSVQNTSCSYLNDGVVVLQSSGGAGGNEYTRTGLGSPQGSTTFSGLAATNYTFTVRDDNNCIATINRTVTKPSPIDITFTNIENATCANPNGKVTANASGGTVTSGYTFEWQNSSQTVLSNQALLQNVGGGIYTVFIKDNNNCLADSSVAITSPDGAQTTYTAVSTKCFNSFDGSAHITITSGTGPFSVKWPDNQNTLQGINLKGGLHNVLITDGNGCTVVQPVNVPFPPQLELLTTNKVLPTCYGACNGQLTLTASGGVGSYTYNWNNGTSPSQSSLCAKTYSVLLRDGNNCSLNQDVILEQPDSLSVKISNVTLPSCKDKCDGALEITAAGGNGSYQYTWANGGNTNSKQNLCPGPHQVTITDQKGCVKTTIVSLNNPPPLPLDLGGGATLCVAQSYVLNAGAGYATYKWTSNTGFTSTQQQVTIKDPGLYFIETINSNGCVAVDTFLLETSTDLLKASFMIPQQAFAGDTVVMIDISWPLPDRIEWNFPSTMRKVIDLNDVIFAQFEPGTYQVGLKAHLGECVDQISKSITILKGEENPDGGRLGYDEFVKTFELFPNPNDGVFEVEVELNEESPISISIWNGPSGYLVKQIHDLGKKIYRKSFDLKPLSSGTYVLRLDHMKGKKYIRFIVH